MQQAYINALIEFCPTIYGRALLPLSLGHLVILEIIANPFVIGGDVTYDDIISAAFVCSNDFKTNCQYLADIQKLQNDIKAWGKQTSKGKRKRSIVVSELAENKKIMELYFKHYGEMPKRWQSGGGHTRQTKVPWQWVIVWKLLDKFEESEAWDMSLTKAMAYYAAYQDTENEDSNLMGEDAIEFEETLGSDKG